MKQLILKLLQKIVKSLNTMRTKLNRVMSLDVLSMPKIIKMPFKQLKKVRISHVRIVDSTLKKY